MEKTRSQQTASSDNVQWTLAQLDVEYLALQNSVKAFQLGRSDLVEVRKRFDILYSRIVTFETSDAFKVLIADPVFASDLKKIRTFLNNAVPLIDGPDDAFVIAISQFDLALVANRPITRSLGLIGLRLFAAVSDTERVEVFYTLVAMGILAAAMIIVLLGLVAVLIRLEGISRQRGKDNLTTLARMQMIVSTALDAVIVLDQKGAIVEFNPSAERIFGHLRADVIGHDLGDLIIPPEMRDMHHKGMKRHALTGVTRVTGKGRLRLEALRKNGERFPIEVAIAKSESEGGTLFVSYLRDLSAEVAAEQDLMKARDNALAGEKAKAQLLAVMSHEMRTPLNGMIGMMELMEDTPLDTQQHSFLTVMQTSGKLLLHHVNDVLTISRLESGQTSARRNLVDLQEVIKEIYANQHALGKVNGNVLAYSMPKNGLVEVMGDALQIRQILLNLVGNAIKFTKNGKVLVEFEHLKHEKQTEIRVTDTGIGIAEEDLERIFDDFVTLDSSYARETEGTGLGLGITRRIVKGLGGTISVTSNQDTALHGSSFTVCLPLEVLAKKPLVQETNKDLAATTAVDPQNHSKNLEILLVEDNAINRMVVHELLGKRGHTVHEAHDGVEGVEMAQKHRYDAILMDISMPRKDGVDATKEIRAGNGLSAVTPIIALTAHAMEEEVSRFLDAGMQAVLVKPTSGKKLEATLLEFVAKHQTLSAHSATDPTDRKEINLIDQEIIDDLIDGLGAEKSRLMMRSFIDSTDASLTALIASANEHSLAEELRREIHKIAGSTAMFGAREMNMKLRQLEEDCKSNRLSLVLVDLPKLSTLWAKTKSALSLYA